MQSSAYLASALKNGVSSVENPYGIGIARVFVLPKFPPIFLRINYLQIMESLMLGKRC